MTITLNGTTGITLPNGSASAPAATGSDTDTGIVYGTNTVQIATGGTTAVTVDSSQNVGIGTSSPAQKLDVASKVQIDTSNAYGKIKIARATDSGLSALYIQGADDAGTANELRLVNAGGSRAAINITGGELRFYATSDTTERMRIDDSGYVLVGCTAYPSSSVAGAALSPSVVSVNPHRFSVGSGTGVITVMTFVNGNGIVGAINTSGSNTVYSTSSDYRLKDNIAPMTGALNKVALLKPCTYTWKADGSAGEGFIAHELAEVFPDAVVGEKDAVDADGEIKAQSIDTSFLVATLTAAIQELKAELDTVKTELATLKGTA